MIKDRYIHNPEIHNLDAPQVIVPFLVNIFHPESVADIGCGTGTFLYVFQELGVREILGIDGAWVDREKLFISPENFREDDLEQKIEVDKKFDLILCLEVAEHLQESAADVLVDNLIALGNTIVFSAAIPNQGGQNHINEQHIGYWVEKFKKKDFIFHDVFRRKVWNNASVNWWYRQNMFLVTHKSVDLSIYPYLIDSAEEIDEYVHPELLAFYAGKTRSLQKKMDTLLNGNASAKLYIKLFTKMLRRKMLGEIGSMARPNKMYKQQSINGISIIVCCYNSAKRLPQTISQISRLNNSGAINWELIIVDNNSSDQTIAVATGEWEKYQLAIPFTVVCETQQGLSYARKKGIETAKYDLLIFCDDDNWLNEDYVNTAYTLMLENESIGIAGGRSVAYIEREKLLWVDRYENVYAVGKQLPETGYANKRGYIIGAGMVIRKKIFQQLETIGFTSILSDRKRNELSSGGDSEICLLTMQLGYDLYYDERLQFTHYISPNRLKWSYCVEMITKGFAHPQIYYAMYDYCFNAVNKNEAVDFENLYRWNMRKQKRILLNEFKGIGKFFSAVTSLLYSKPGNDKEIKLKTAINKLRYMKKNKQQLAADFETILSLAKRIHEYKCSTFVTDQQTSIQKN